MKRRTRLFTVSFSTSILLLFMASSVYSEDMSVNGYSLSMVNISQSGCELEVSGRLEYGQSCSKLKLSFYLQSDKGNRKTVNCFVKDAGTGSCIFEGKTRTNKNERLSWDIEEVRTKCMGN